jgi:uncharacterized phage-associated protein
MKVPLPKLKAILLYFCENTEQKYLGKVKLMKLFYFLDFLHVKRFASPITFDRYVKLGHGPIPSTVKNLVDDLDLGEVESVLADTIRVSKPWGQVMHRIVPTRKLTNGELGFFSENEMGILKEVCQKFGSANTKTIEDASHAEAPWRDSQMCQEIPYTAATRDADCDVTEEEITLSLKMVGL